MPMSAKREAQINLIKTSLRPKGYQPETFAGKTTRPIDAHVIQVMKDFVADGTGSGSGCQAWPSA